MCAGQLSDGVSSGKRNHIVVTGKDEVRWSRGASGEEIVMKDFNLPKGLLDLEDGGGGYVSKHG